MTKPGGRPNDTHADSALALSLFVLWAKARHCQERILSDLDARFDVLCVHEIEWSQGRIMENYQRFYADIPVRGVYHALNKGVTPFLAMIVRDPGPRVEARPTSRGLRTVNANLLDAKTEYRKWTEQFAVHSSETVWETDRDLIMLFGSGALNRKTDTRQRWDGTVTRIERDLTGADGWASASELFSTLNHSVAYSVLGAVDDTAADELLRRRPIDLLTDDGRHLHAVLNAAPRDTPTHGGHYRVKVAGKAIPIGVRVVGDGYLPPKWAAEILESRALGSGGFYRSAARSAFDELAYRTFAHRPAPGREEQQRLATLASLLQIEGWPAATVVATTQAKQLIDRILEERGCGYTRPLDATVVCNPEYSASRWPALAQMRSFARRCLTMSHRRSIGTLHITLGQLRDRALLAAPWVRRVKRWVRR